MLACTLNKILHRDGMRQAEQRLRVIKLLLIWQLAISVMVGAAGLVWGFSAALGAFAGGIIVWLPNCYFALRAFRHRGARAARQIVRSFYAGFAGKLVLTVALFVAVFAGLKPLHAPAVFAGFLIVQAMNWVVPLVVGIRQAKQV